VTTSWPEEEAEIPTTTLAEIRRSPTIETIATGKVAREATEAPVDTEEVEEITLITTTPDLATIPDVTS